MDEQIVLSKKVVQQLHRFRQCAVSAPEAGGALLGKILLANGATVIEALTEPGVGDRQSRFSFFRSKRHHQEAQRYWRKTTQTGAFLGLWHTHPEAVPVASSVDFADWSYALQQGVYPSPGLLFAIAGTQAVGFWEGRKHKPIEFIGYWRWEKIDV